MLSFLHLNHLYLLTTLLNAVDKDEIDQILSENNIDTQEIEDYENLELEEI